MCDFTDAEFLGYMESEGCMDTNEGLIHAVSFGFATDQA